MTIILDGTKGTTTPGLYSSTTFTGTYTDGIVVDYTSTLGRISVGTSDGLAFYNGGVATTELMRLDSSGNLGIGTSSPATLLDVRGANKTVTSQYGNINAYSTDSYAIDKGGSLSFGGKYASDGSSQTFGSIAGRKESAGDGSWSGYLQFNTGTTLTERMRIDSSGNVGIGTTIPNAKLYVASAATQAIVVGQGTIGTDYGIGRDNSNGALTFYGNQTGAVSYVFSGVNGERMRIDSSGNLLVGSSSQIWDERLSARNSASNVVAGFYAQSTSYTSSVIRAQAETAAGTGWYLFEGRSSLGTFQYGIRGNGTVATSDIRRKKNIEPARSYLQDICSIPVVKYNWKSDEDGTPKELGWIAQDVEKVFPNMVVTHHDGPNDDQEVLLLKKEVFLPMLMKCIQEQQAIITALTERVAALENK